VIFEHVNYRTFLRASLEEIAAGRDGYSLRAFAEKVGIAASHLSAAMSGKKPLSVDAALRIAVKLGLSELESQYFCLLVQLEAEPDPEYRCVLQERLNRINSARRVHDLSVEAFRAVSEWYHFAILELTYLKGFHISPSSVSKILGIAKPEAEAAIGRLLQLELLEETSPGQFAKVEKAFFVKSDVPSAAIRKFHKQLLAKAAASLDQHSPDDRVNRTDLLPFDSKGLERVRALADRFASDVIKISESSKVRDGVYSLSVHFFELTSSVRERN
jgi:uncharacterized protein (TIGR02147 family)